MKGYGIQKLERCPTHPGAVLREDILPSLQLSVSDLARHLHVSRQAVYGILNERTGISAQMALRLGTFLGNGPSLWVTMQSHYNLWQAQTKLQQAEQKVVKCKTHHQKVLPKKPVPATIT